ncbi:MAG: GHMP family kinase ATP-binding protein [Promethearchaeota archaeon]|jgi:D-glycero-alpha-D-manno-heptose-7-phosphate kinase
MTQKIILSRAPVRICDIGGWTDTWFYPNGAVFNICVDLYSYIRIISSTLDKIKIISENLDLTSEIQNVKNITYDGTLDLLKAAIKRLEIKEGIDIYARTEAPPGCGTGTSASIAVSLIAALAKFSDISMSNDEIAQLAHRLETEELNLESGVQDQYAAVYGGINFMEIKYPSVKLTHIKISTKRICELESRMFLLYLGSRSSSNMHKSVIKNYKRGERKTLESFEIMKNCAYEMKNAVNSNDINYMGEIMNNNWEAQKNLHRLMTNQIINKAEQIAKKNGAVGFKLNGAGGGGSATIIAEIGKEFLIKKKLTKQGYQILPAKLDFLGNQTWEV